MDVRLRGVAAVAAALVGLSLPVAHHPAQAIPRADVTASSGAASTQRVTLVSGDVITVRHMYGRTVLRATPGPGRQGMQFLRRVSGGEESVIPADALAPLARGALDPRLFNVTRLLADHGSDAATRAVPVIVRYASGTPALRARAATRAAQSGPARDLTALGMTATTIDKGRAAVFWSAVVVPRTAMATAGVRKLWLDGVKRPVLDRSVPQIGAPVAWRAGFTGKGVKVAVLDSGYDATHPDLRGRVSASRDFTGSGGTSDLEGHGTHVASTLGGSGAASGGKYRGVAPDADLMIGRVCAQEQCSDSAILAGMQWAVQQGARIVNMSLGGADTPGTDPLEEAIDDLTARSGALFVVAAGNDGPAEQTVSTPASADAALAVAAVDRDDKVADFSSRGLRIGDDAVKPDIAAPGVAIVAARATGTLPDEAVDDHYATLSGTSMAAPHVAGAAALLAQQHPQWKAEALKAALMSTAARVSGGVPEVGAGRVDVARATAGQVFAATPSLSYGIHLWPHTPAHDPPVTKTVTYSNDGGAPVTLALSLTVVSPDGGAAPAGMFTVPPSVNVAPAGHAAVPVTVNTAVRGADGRYTAVLTAVTAGDGIRLRTPFSVQRERESYSVTLSAVSRAGTPVPTGVEMVRQGATGADRADRLSVQTIGRATTVRVPKGSWNLATAIVEPETAGATPAVTLAGTPALRVDRARTVVFDARKGKAVDVTVPEASARLGAVSAGITIGPKDWPTTWETTADAGPSAKKITGLYAIPDRTRAGDYQFWSMTQWARPHGDDFAGSPYQYNVFLPALGRIPARLSHAVAKSELATVVEDHYLFTRPAEITVAPMAGFANKPPGGFFGDFPFGSSRHTSYYTTERERIVWDTAVEQRSHDTVMVTQEAAGDSYRAGRRYPQRWFHPALGPAFPDVGARPLPYAKRYDTAIVTRIPLFSDESTGHYGFSGAGEARTQLFLDGASLGVVPSTERAQFTVPRRAGDYRLVAEARPGTALGGGFSSRVTAEWTFRSVAPRPEGPIEALPLTAVQYLPPLKPASYGRVTIPLRLTSAMGPLGTAGVTSFTVETSRDDGQTWQPATVTRHRSGWTAAVIVPRGAKGWLSARSLVTHRSGNTARQIVIHAYRL